MSIHLAKVEHEAAYQDLCRILNKHADKLTAIELLAIAANMVGKLVALQDQRTTSPELAMKTVSLNIEHGNRSVIDHLANNSGGTA